MIKHRYYILSIVSSFLICSLTQAQFLNFQLKIEPELTTTTEQNLSFGTLISNSGIQEVELGDLNMGVFSISAMNAQYLSVDLIYPDHLSHINPAYDDQIPLLLEASYTNNGKNAPRESIPIINDNAYIAVSDNPSLNSDIFEWDQLYIYVFGTIDIGNVATGNYEADVILSIEYN